jgi:hypothetical protein
MARKELWWVVLLGLLIFGLFLASCPTDGGNNKNDGKDSADGGNNNKNDDKDSAKKLTITGIEGISGDVSVMFTTDVNNQSASVLIRNEDGDGGTGVGGKGTIYNGSITIPLKVIQFSSGPSLTENNWTGTGSYYIWLWDKDNFNGSPPYSAAISASSSYEKVSFLSETTKVLWNKFGQSPE